jgi:hypothetical protein
VGTAISHRSSFGCIAFISNFPDSPSSSPLWLVLFPLYPFSPAPCSQSEDKRDEHVNIRVSVYNTSLVTVAYHYNKIERECTIWTHTLSYGLLPTTDLLAARHLLTMATPFYNCGKLGHRHRHLYYRPFYLCPWATLCDFCDRGPQLTTNLRNKHIITHLPAGQQLRDWVLMGKRGRPPNVEFDYFGFNDPPNLSKWQRVVPSQQNLR